MTNIMRQIWYHPSGTFYGQQENMDFMPYMRISRKFYDIWDLWNNVNVADPIMRNQNQIMRKKNDKFIKVSIFKCQIMGKNTA